MISSALMERFDDDTRLQLDEVMREMKHVEQELQLQVGSRVELVTSVSRHTLDGGGKRLRPAFVWLAAKATGLPYDIERTRKLGACMEMIHMATLIHDDVVDNSPMRRGRETAHVAYGSTASVLAGDCLLAKAMDILAEDGDLNIIRCVSKSVVGMAEGEVREVETRNRFDLSLQDHFEILDLKTAAFIESCCEVGALIAGADSESRDALKHYGKNIGLAFQIVDDLIDYQGPASVTGKTPGTDFREGCATLPLILLRDHLSEQEFEVASRKFGNGVGDDEIQMIINWMETRGAFAESAAYAGEYLEAALQDLQRLPDSPTRDLLGLMAQFVVNRSA
ncbi:MAG: polyprenyl synthetase family protein [Armatimonadetes bacterium]|nr:polyprenyl synthetase family protein [Armatimonadota bacterium]